MIKKLKGRYFIMKRKISVIYKILTALCLFTGITFNLYKADSAISILSYYTSQSNIICLIAFIIYSVKEIQDKNGKYKSGDIYYLTKGALVIMIFITTFFYHIALAPIGFNMEKNNENLIKEIADFLLHTLSPILVILDYFIFDKKGKFKTYYPFLWLIIPLNYVIYVYTYATFGGTFCGVGGSKRFAYFFLDYTRIGIYGVISWIVLMIIGILIISYVLIMLDKYLYKKRAKRKTR